MEKYFSKNKDVDRLILQELDDRSLFETLLTSKYAYEITIGRDFWRNRLMLKYPATLSYKPSNLNWKEYYLSVVYYIDKLKREESFDYTYGDPIYLYKLVNRKNPRIIVDIVRELHEHKNYDAVFHIFKRVHKGTEPFSLKEQMEHYFKPEEMEMYKNYFSK